MRAFRTDNFLDSADPWKYMMEAGLADPATEVPPAELARLADLAGAADDAHLAHALVVGRREDPPLFAAVAAGAVGHPNPSVRAAAVNLLSEVPADDADDAVRRTLRAQLEAAGVGPESFPQGEWPPTSETWRAASIKLLRARDTCTPHEG